MGPEVKDGWTKLLKLELKDFQIGEELADEFSYKIDGERAEAGKQR